MTVITENIINKITNLIVILNRRGELTYISPSVKKILGYEPNSLLGKQGWKYTSHKQSEIRELVAVTRKMAIGIRPLVHEPFEQEVISTEGHKVWLLWNVSSGTDDTLVAVGYDITKRKNAEKKLELKNKFLLYRNSQMIDSIEYASIIQKAILPDKDEIGKHFSDLFLFYQPKDIVSGDFYWYHNTGQYIFLAAADCTGHGVPAALISVLGCSLLREIIVKNKIYDPSEILYKLDGEIINAFVQKGMEPETHDGMDISLLRLDLKNNAGVYSGAFRPLIHIRGDELTDYDAQHFPIGFYFGIKKEFRNRELYLEKGDLLYMFSDGYTDQFGGENVKKFNRKRFRNLLFSISKMHLQRQEKELAEHFDQWKGKREQVDDVMVIGIKI